MGVYLARLDDGSVNRGWKLRGWGWIKIEEYLRGFYTFGAFNLSVVVRLVLEVGVFLSGRDTCHGSDF
jgi:hypothetical protein